ncbi:hypothetical protein HYPSUDRAFT_32651 [Hypholoma sublateritium FD-334 SS-4]|uniref:DUF6697 domain-containing protein n=1 Tax=Hypholoma sublateritium (strain FD-334 SS-4) TaxID=945553 RepID=A0A0D2PES0_HYPSF|nr:hypothetical protein HYPSUDRAFT_32651 [Hypholoma sublateritium FD-334 SS-4]
MDEAFWSSVVKRWSDASENVIKLKEELAKLEKERAAHRCHSATSSSSINGSRPPVSERPPKHSMEAQGDDRATTSTILEELEDVEIGLAKAKEEYRKLQKELAASSRTIAELTLRNQKLVQDHREEIKRLRGEFQSTLTAKRFQDFQSLMEPNEVEDASRKSRSTTTTLSISTVAGAQLVANLERQIETLKRSVEASEAEQHDMHHELLSTREKLHKAEENIRILLASIVKLQAVARYPGYTSLQHASDNSMLSPSRKSSKISFTSNKSHSRKNPIIHHSPITLQQIDLSHLPLHSSLISEKTAIKHDSATFSTPPLLREKALSRLPAISDNIPAIDALDNNFDRAFLKYILGEGAHSLIGYISGASETADKKNRVSSYLCPTLDHHPWCPSTPGQHGYIFVGLGKDKDSYKSAITRNLFVGLSKGQGKHRIFRYLGKYRVSRVEPLSCEEWATLSDETKVVYANLTYGKGNGLPSVDDILSTYESGKSRIPCVQLQCIGFDLRFYKALISSKKSERKLAQ